MTKPNFAAPGDLAITCKIISTDMSVPQSPVRLANDRRLQAGRNKFRSTGE
jgi:hypothetical protein